jgi:ABC-type branched-subunit amino acid transport system substrate-binding protein
MLAVVALAVPALATTAGAATSSAKKSCNGPAIKVMNVTNLTATIQTTVPDIPKGVEAAAKNITDTCQLGGPVTVIACDDKFNGNDAAACARQAVQEKVLALVGTYGSWGDVMLPIVTAAGIPSVGNNTNGPQESTNPLSFGTFNPPVVFSGYFTLAASVGAKRVALFYLDLPQVKFFVDLGSAQAKAVGMTLVDTIPIPVTATDMAQFAARVVSSNADAAMFVLGPGQIAPLVRSMVQQGLDLKNKVRPVAGLNTITPDFISQLGQDAVGFLSPGTGWTPDDRKNPAVKRFIKELKKIKTPSDIMGNLTTQALNAWGAMHMIADVMEGASSMDPATLVSRLNSAGPIDMNQYGIPNLDFAKNPFPAGSVLASIPRSFQDTMTINQVGKDLKMHPLSKKFVSALTVSKGIKTLKL